MNKLPLDLQMHFFKYYNDEITVSDFERWVYANKDLEQYLDNETYTKLISLNFKDKYIKHEMGKTIDIYLDFGKYEERKLIKVLTDLVDRTNSFTKSLIETYELYCSGYDFFNNLAFGYGLTFSEDFYDYNDWEKLTHEEKTNRIDEVYHGVKSEASLILMWFDEGVITPTGEVDEVGHFEFIDKRTDIEKKLRTVETIDVLQPDTNKSWIDFLRFIGSSYIKKVFKWLKGRSF